MKNFKTLPLLLLSISAIIPLNGCSKDSEPANAHQVFNRFPNGSEGNIRSTPPTAGNATTDEKNTKEVTKTVIVTKEVEKTTPKIKNSPTVAKSHSTTATRKVTHPMKSAVSKTPEKETVTNDNNGENSGGESEVTCKELKAQGIFNIKEGDPRYSSDKDRDGDGVACEKK